MRGLGRSLLDTVVRNHPNLGLDRRAEFFVSRFFTYLPPSSKILDIGGGWGFYSAPLRNRGHASVVLDVVSPGYQKAPVIIYNGQEPIPFEDNSFDVSLLVTVLHHMEDPVAVIREALRVTRKRLIVVEDVYHHALGRIWTKWRDQIFNFEYWGHPGQFKTKEEWLKLFGCFNLKCVHHENHYTWLSGLRILNALMVFDKC